MKKNDYLLLVATGAYSFLFYRQNAGLNFLLFNVALLALLALKNINLVKNKKWLWAAGMCLVSSVSIFVTSSALSIIANIASLLLLSAYSFNVATSALFSFLFSCYTVVSCFVYIMIDAIKRASSVEEGSAGKKGYKILATIIVLVLSVVFFMMYKSSNPLFAENTKWINFDFISLGWIFFTLGGFVLVYAFLYHKVIEQVQTWENDLPVFNGQSPEDDPALKRFEAERYAGLLLFILLNGMLVILNMGDVQTLYFNGGLPKNVSHSDFVHNGVGITILSIIIATSLIMYLFRKEFPGIKTNKALIACVYLWIFQNVMMLSSTAIRNQVYIHDFNFTYKRVGVYVWLALAVIGLCVMFWKIWQKRSNWYLIRTNVAVWFSVLVISGCFNWDKMITNYNISNKPLKDVDFYYLFSLSDANIPELMAVTKRAEFEQLNSNLKNFTNDRSDHYYTLNYRHMLNLKLVHYLSDYTSDWRSFDLRDKEVHYSIFHN